MFNCGPAIHDRLFYVFRGLVAGVLIQASPRVVFVCCASRSSADTLLELETNCLGGGPERGRIHGGEGREGFNGIKMRF